MVLECQLQWGKKPRWELKEVLLVRADVLDMGNNRRFGEGWLYSGFICKGLQCTFTGGVTMMTCMSLV